MNNFQSMILAAVIAGVSAGGTLFVLERVSGNASGEDNQQYEYKYIYDFHSQGRVKSNIVEYLLPELKAHIEKGWEPVGGPTIWTQKYFQRANTAQFVFRRVPYEDADFAIQLIRRPIELANKFKTVDEET